MLLADMLNSIIRDITALATQNDENLQSAAIVNVVFLGFFCLLIFPIANIVLFLVNMYKDCNSSNPKALAICRRIIVAFVQTLGAIFYFYGDNIGYIIQNYSEELGCGDQCVINNRIAAVVTLGLALIILHLFPVAFKYIDFIIINKNGCNNDDWNDKTSKWNSGMDMITIIVKIDILYTAVAVMTQTDEFCGHVDIALSWSFIVICGLVGIAFMVVNLFYSYVKINDDSALIILVPSLVFLALSVFMYLLADNQQPLDCAFNCDTFATNHTINEISCNTHANSSLRLPLMLVAFIVVIVLALVWIFIVICSEKTEKIIEDEKNSPDGTSKPV